MEAAKIQQRPASGDLAAQLSSLIKTETAAAENVLATIGALEEARSLAGAVATYQGVNGDAAFVNVRKLITKTLLRATPNGYSLNEVVPHLTERPDDMVQDMVEASSGRLATIGAIGS